MPSGQTLTTAGGHTANTITASGLITANAGVTVPSGQTLTTAGGHTANTITASGLITANAGVTVNTGSLTCANDTSSKTYTATNTTSGTNDIVTMRYDSTNGLRFTQTLVAANDVRYDIIQKTNNVDSTAPVLSFYKSNVGIGTTNPNAELQITNSTTATNPDTPGTAISLYVHNPTNSASQNSVIYNRIGGTSAGKVIYSFNVLSSYGCSLVINGNDTTNRLLRFNNSSDASGTDLMVINNSNGNVSIGNTDTATHKLNVTGDINVSGAFRVGGTVLKPATAVLADTATILATSRNIAGTAFNGSGNIDISYPNLTNKLTSGTGITISAATPPVISTNLTAGTNITFSGTAPNITINSTASGGSSQWVTSGANIYYNNGNVGIGVTTTSDIDDNPEFVIPTALLYVKTGPTDICEVVFKGGAAARIWLTGNNGHSSTIISQHTGYGNTDLYFCTSSGNTLPTERMRIASNGNVVIGGNVNVGSLTNPSDSRIKKDIEDINDDTALNKLLLIKPTIYNYIDEGRNKGFGKVYGFIAQQIREIIPEAVPIINTITPIPNIYKRCLIKNKREVYHSIPLNTPIDTFIKINNDSYKIKEIYDDYFVIDNDIDTDEAFVFGYNVDDFHTLNKDYIFTLNVCATQELHRRIEAQNIIIKSHEDRIKDLEEKVDRLLTNT